MILTGLTMSPGFDAIAPWLLDLFGGRQSARSLHFVAVNLILLFLVGTSARCSRSASGTNLAR